MGEIVGEKRAGDGIRTHEMLPWEGNALPLGDTRIHSVLY